jgi:hypothetical protein
MSEPFRDGMEAALERTGALEEENEVLREELERLRRSADALRENARALQAEDTDPRTRNLAHETLDVLDQLDVVSQRPHRLRVHPGTAFTVVGTERPLTAVTEPTPASARPDPALAALAASTTIPAVAGTAVAGTAVAGTAVAGVATDRQNIVLWVLGASLFFFALGFVLGILVVLRHGGH